MTRVEVFPAGGCESILGGESNEDAKGDLIITDLSIAIVETVDTKLDNIFRLEFARLGLDRFGREAAAVDIRAV